MPISDTFYFSLKQLFFHADPFPPPFKFAVNILTDTKKILVMFSVRFC